MELSQGDAFDRAAEKLAAARPIRKARLRQIAGELQDNLVERAEKALGDYLDRHPRDPDALCLMSEVALRRGRPRDAALLLAECLKVAPDFVAARLEYARLLYRLHRQGPALAQVEQLLEGDSRNPLFRRLKADILAAVGEEGISLAISRDLAAETPQRAESWLLCGHALRANGFVDESIDAYRKALECRQDFGLAWWALASVKARCLGAEDIAAMEDRLERPGLAAEDRIALQFSLGKAYEDCGCYDRSFANYARGNAALRLRVGRDRETMTSRVGSNKRLFTPQFLQSRNGTGCPAPDPIFVVGQPRSGTTLIEQILSSHTAIEGTGELPYIVELAARLEDRECVALGVDYPQVLEKLEPAFLARLGEEYLENARVHRRHGRPFFVDKMPRNYFHVGMIHLIFPNAKIIDARRHPAACRLSIFKHYVATTNLRLSELGLVYRDYVELMAHFDLVLPGRIHRVFYEELVASPEAEIRRLFKYLGLPFEQRCLRFYETDRSVRTPSSEQVRRPISGESLEHWRCYERWLGPLIDSLGSALTMYPSVPDELR